MPPPFSHCADDGAVHYRPRVDALFAMVPRQGKLGRRCAASGFRFRGRRGCQIDQEELISPHSTGFPSCSAPAGNRWLVAAAAAQVSAFTIETRAQRDRSWGRFQSFLHEIGNRNDPFLLRLQPEERVEVFTGFAAAIREGWTGCADDRDAGRTATSAKKPHGACVGRKAGTVRAAIDGVVQTYRANKHSSPAHDSRGRLDPLLVAQLRGYALDNPEPSQRQALPAAVVEVVANVKTTETHRAIGQLVTGAFFIAMRSCEYAEASGSRRTKPVQKGNIIFRRGGDTIESFHESVLATADTVSVTYWTQKNGDRGVTVTQHRTKA
jgi:hypothetical protein